MPLGYLDTKYIDLPGNIDQAYLRGLVTQNGVSFASLLTQLDGRLRTLNAVSDPLVATLASYTTEAQIDATTPTMFTLEERNEYGLPRPVVVAPRAHMLPIRTYDIMLGFTEDYLEQATQPTLLNHFDSVAASFVRGIRIKALERLTSDAEVRIAPNSTATNPGFAGSGTGENAFTGTYPDGTALPGGFTFYMRDTSANLAVVIKAARDKLKRWHPAPYDLIASQTQIDLIAADATNFVRAESPLILRAQGTAAANVNPDDYVGVFDKDIRVRNGLLELGTSPNIVVFKTYGAFNAQNPLAYRYDPKFPGGRGVTINSRSFYPLHNAVMATRFGIGTKNRTAAVNILIAASGGYLPPTIA